MSKINLIIKGKRATAENEAAKRNLMLEFETYTETKHYTTGYVANTKENSKIVKDWFFEDVNLGAPFFEGSLLFFSTLYEPIEPATQGKIL